MGSFSIWHWIIVLVVVLVLFGGGGKLSRLMGDAGKGIKSFKKGLKEGDDGSDEDEPKAIDKGSDAVASSSEEPEEARKKAANG
jgi:sec-independent protein translocase protein TatA